jgi:protein-S-isoprenylcysteine O-methyltransferase
VKAAARRVLQGLLLAAFPVAFLALAWPAGLRLPHLWLAIVIGLCANTLQPSYSPFEGQRTRDDHLTGVQILWTVYGVQAAAAAELVLRRPVLAMDPVSWAALSAMVLGLLLRTWAVATLGRWFTWNVEVQPGQEVVESGPYRFLRHPSYAGALLTYLGVCLLFHSWIAAAVALVALPAAFIRRISYEEELLKQALPGYASYMSRRGALFPIPSGQAMRCWGWRWLAKRVGAR